MLALIKVPEFPLVYAGIWKSWRIRVGGEEVKGMWCEGLARVLPVALLSPNKSAPGPEVLLTPREHPRVCSGDEKL